MNAQLAQEDESRRRREMRTKQQMYREQLAEQLNEKNNIKKRENKESSMWFNMENNQIQRQDEIENLNNMAKKGKILQEKQNRERMIAQRDRIRQEDEQSEKQADEDILNTVNKEIQNEHARLLEKQAKEKEK